MDCPNCRGTAPAGAPECPSCGVIFAKFAERKAREKAEVAAHAAMLDAPASASRALDPRKTRAAAIAFVALWLAVLATTLHRSMRKTRAAKTARPAAAVFTDPKTGETRKLTVVESPSARPAAAALPARPAQNWESSWVEEEGKKRR